MLDKYYIEAKKESIEKMRIVRAGFMIRAKECLSDFAERAEDRTAEDYMLLTKNLSAILAVAEDMKKDLLDRIEYLDRQLGINAEEDEAAEPAKASEGAAEGEDDTH